MRALNLLLLAMFMVLQFRLWIGEGSVAHYVSLQDKIQVQSADNKTLLKRNQKLIAEVIDLQRGSDTIEEYARQQLGMIKTGETFFLVVN